MISDADRELRKALIALNHQICTNQSERSATHYGRLGYRDMRGKRYAEGSDPYSAHAETLSLNT